MIKDTLLWRLTVPQSSPSYKGGGRTDRERAFRVAEGGAEEWFWMELLMDEDGTGNTKRVDCVVGAFLPFIDEANEDFKCF